MSLSCKVCSAALVTNFPTTAPTDPLPLTRYVSFKSAADSQSTAPSVRRRSWNSHASANSSPDRPSRPICGVASNRRQLRRSGAESKQSCRSRDHLSGAVSSAMVRDRTAMDLRGLKPPPGAHEDGFGLDGSEAPRSVPLANPAEAERMTGRVGVDLEIVRLVVIVRRFEYLRPQRHHFGVRLVEVFHP